MESLPQIALVLHIIGLTTVAGTTLARYIVRRQFWNQYSQDKQKGLAVMQSVSKLPRVAAIGMLVLILSGITMIAARRGVYGQQLWFQVKMIFVLLIIVTSALVMRLLEKRLQKLLVEDTAHGNVTPQIGSVTGRIGYVQLCLLLFFIVIFILTSFRFN